MIVVEIFVIYCCILFFVVLCLFFCLNLFMSCVMMVLMLSVGLFFVVVGCDIVLWNVD